MLSFRAPRSKTFLSQSTVGRARLTYIHETPQATPPRDLTVGGCHSRL